jgi:glyoxylase-like metal-dependent hydrolase (beta-lactamase superfamily II)
VRVADGVLTVEGTRVGNAYLVATEDGFVVIDTGMPGNAARILAAIEQSGHRPHEIRAIVLTHWHPDHMGSAAALQRATGAPAAVGALDAPCSPEASCRRRAGGMRLIRGLLRSGRSSPTSGCGRATRSGAWR